MNPVVCIIQARVGSSRLPGKVMKPLCKREVIWHVTTRVKASQGIDQIVVATTSLLEDDVIADFCQREKVACYRGDENNVLDRYFKAAKLFNAQTIVRVTSDCPLIDPAIVGTMLSKFPSKKADYFSNVLTRTFPKGLDTEIFSFNALSRAWQQASDLNDLEHVTPYIINHPDMFKLANYENKIDLSAQRWTIDTLKDYQFLSQIYEEIYDENNICLMDDVLRYLANKEAQS